MRFLFDSARNNFSDPRSHPDNQFFAQLVENKKLGRAHRQLRGLASRRRRGTPVGDREHVHRRAPPPPWVAAMPSPSPGQPPRGRRQLAGGSRDGSPRSHGGGEAGGARPTDTAGDCMPLTHLVQRVLLKN